MSVLPVIPKDQHTGVTPSLLSGHCSSGHFHQGQFMLCKRTQTQSLQPLVYTAVPAPTPQAEALGE